MPSRTRPQVPADSKRPGPIRPLVALATLLALIATAGGAAPADNATVQEADPRHISLFPLEESPVLLEEFQPFFIVEGWGLGFLTECEGGEPGEHDETIVNDDGLRFDLYLNDEKQEGDEFIGCDLVDEGDELFVKNHRYDFEDGLPQGSYTLRGEWWWHEEPQEPMETATLVLHVGDAADTPDMDDDPHPVFDWAVRAGSEDDDILLGVGVTHDGGVAISGWWDGSSPATFGAGDNAVTLEPVDFPTAYVVRYEPNGDLRWAGRIAGSATAGGLTVDRDDNVIVTGSFVDTATFGDGEQSITLTSGPNVGNVYVASYDPDGQPRWAVNAPGGGSDTWGLDVAVDTDGNVFVGGAFADSVTFGEGDQAVTLNSEGEEDVFLASYSVDGEFRWAVRVGGGPRFDDGGWVAVADNGDPVVAGQFVGTATFGEGDQIVTLESAGDDDIFVARFDPDGKLRWAVRAGGPDWDALLDVAVDSGGNTIVTGGFEASATFGEGEQTVTLDSAGDEDAFVASYDPDGQLRWAIRAASGTGFVRGKGVVVDDQGNAIVAGHADGPATVGDGDNTEAIDAGGFLASYDPQGDLNWIEPVGHGGRIDLRNGVLALAGMFTDALTLGEGDEAVTLESVGWADIFVARYLTTVAADPPDDGTIAYAVSGPGPEELGSSLYIVDPAADGQDTLIGAVETASGSSRGLRDIALDHDGTMYGVRTRTDTSTLQPVTELYVIDPDTAEAALVGDSFMMQVNGLEVSPEGQLLGSSFGEGLPLTDLEGSLVVFDVETGQATRIGPFGSGLESSGDLAFSPDTVLYGSARTRNVDADVLVTIDVETGAAIPVDPENDLSYSDVFGLFFVGDDLFGMTDGAPECDRGALLQIDRGSGVGTFVRCLDFGAWGATTDPQTIEEAPADANTTTTISSVEPSPSVAGASYTVFWEVAVDPPEAGTPTGTVEVTGGGSCSAPVEAESCELVSTEPGTKQLVATYEGDDNFKGSASDAFTHEVLLGFSGIEWSVVDDAPDADVSVVDGDLHVVIEGEGDGSAGVQATVPFDGDFDLVVEYEVVTWPEDNRWYNARMNAHDLDFNPDVGTLGVLRGWTVGEDEFGDPDFGSVYGLIAEDRMVSVPTEDESGTLRLQRRQSRLLGYFLRDDAGCWELIGRGRASTGPTDMTLLISGSANPEFSPVAPPGGVHLAFSAFGAAADLPLCQPSQDPPGRDGEGPPGREDLGMILLDISAPELDANSNCQYTAELAAEGLRGRDYGVELVVSHGTSSDPDDIDNAGVLVQEWEITRPVRVWEATADTVTHAQDGHFHFFEVTLRKGDEVVDSLLEVTGECPDPDP